MKKVAIDTHEREDALIRMRCQIPTLLGKLCLLGILAIILVFLFATLRPGLQPAGEPYPAPLDSSYPAPEPSWTFPPLPTEFPPGYVPMINGATLTPFPNPCEIVVDEPFITPTALPITKTTDLTEGLSDDQKHVVIVQRENGSYEKFIISSTSDELKNLLDLGANDVIINGYPFVPLPGGEPPLSNSEEKVTPTPTVISETIDLASQIPNEQKCVFVIQRASGINEQILILLMPGKKGMNY